MARDDGISGMGLAIGAVGLWMIYAAIKNVPTIEGLRALLAGKLLPGTPSEPTTVAFQGGVAGAHAGNTAGGIAGGAIAGATGLIKPVAGQIGDGFGVPRPGGRTHMGVDIIADAGTPVAAAGSGIVTGRGYDLGAGNYVELDHPGGIRTKYFHLSRFAVYAGDKVTIGQTIGYVGSTGNSSGPHLHFEVWQYGKAQDPLKYIGG